MVVLMYQWAARLSKNFEELREEGAPGLYHRWEPTTLRGCGHPWASRNTQLSSLWVWLCQQPPHHLCVHHNPSERSTHTSVPSHTWGHKVPSSVPSPTPEQQGHTDPWSPSLSFPRGLLWWHRQDVVTSQGWPGRCVGQSGHCDTPSDSNTPRHGVMTHPEGAGSTQDL